LKIVEPKAKSRKAGKNGIAESKEHRAECAGVRSKRSKVRRQKKLSNKDLFFNPERVKFL
jgi:hypothetical protein